MDLGAVFPTTQIGTDPAVIRDFAQTAEGLGYRRLLVYDHVLGAVHADRTPPLTGPYTESDPFHEPLVLLGYLAACTTTIELGRGARPAATPDRAGRQASRRSRHPVSRTAWCSQWVPVGTTSNTRASVRHLLRAAVASTNRSRCFGSSGVNPSSTIPESSTESTGPGSRRDPCVGGIPVWFGGGAEASLQRAARSGDGFVFGSASPHTHTRAARLRELLVEHGRDPGDFPMETMIDYSLGPDVWRQQVSAWTDSGGSILSIRTMSTGADHHGVARVELSDAEPTSPHSASSPTLVRG